MANKRGKTYEAPDMAGFLRRIARAMVRRAAEGDLETLSAIQQVQAELDAALEQAAAAAHAAGYSWTEIGRELGISRQAARQRFTPAAVLEGDRCPHGRTVASRSANPCPTGLEACAS